MAKLVQITCVTHNPQLVRTMQRIDSPALEHALDMWNETRQKLAEAKPDVILIVANDHLNQWFMDNMPAFLIGKSPKAHGPFPHEVTGWGASHYEVAVDRTFARALIEGGFRKRVDFAFSEEFTMDHAFTVPLSFLRPEADIPIIPLFVNAMAPPMPTAARFYEVGEALREIIEELPSDLRVAALFSGHLSVEIGGPRMLTTVRGESVDPEFDTRMTELIATADNDGLIREATYERMDAAGHAGGTGFLIFVMAVGMSRRRLPTAAESVFSETNTMPFFRWDLFEEAER